jgi:hypothetical protein
MTVEPPITSPKSPASPEVLRQRIERLVRDHLVGRNADPAAVVADLLAITSEVGELSCCCAADHGLRFQLGGGEPFEVELDRNRGKLRAMCANLAVLSKAADREPAQIYGGEGTIRQTWKARWSNTMGKHDFTIRVER